MKDRIILMREKEKEIRKILDDLYAIRDLKNILEEDFDYKEYLKEIMEGIIFIIFFLSTFYFLWFILP